MKKKKHIHRYKPTYPGVWECRCGKEKTMNEIKERELCKTKNGIQGGNVSGIKNQMKQNHKK